MIYAALGSVLLITLFMRYVWNRFSPFQICAICAGSSGAWLMLFAANKIYGYYVDPVLISIFVGGTVVGIMYELSAKLPEGRSRLVFKTSFLIAGFWTAYMLMGGYWLLFALGAVIISVMGYAWTRAPKPNKPNKSVEEIKEKMKQCC